MYARSVTYIYKGCLCMHGQSHIYIRVVYVCTVSHIYKKSISEQSEIWHVVADPVTIIDRRYCN